MSPKLSILLTGIYFLVQSGCGGGAKTSDQDRQLAENLLLEWEVVSNQVADSPRCRTRITLTNTSALDLGDHGWTLFYNQEAGVLITGSVTGSVTLEHLGGDFYRLSPNTGFSLRAGEEVTIVADFSGWFIKEQQAPAGAYLVFFDTNGAERSRYSLSPPVVKPFLRPEQRNRFLHDMTPDPTPGWQFEQNEKLSLLDGTSLPLVVPTPAHVSSSGSHIALDGTWVIHFGPGLDVEAGVLAGELEQLLGVSIGSEEQTGGGSSIINLGVGGNNGGPESYFLEVSADHGITIRGGDGAGVFYGMMSLMALVPPANQRGVSASLSIPVCTIRDAPRFSYRGLHLDVARNFNRKEALLKMIDVMSFYKLNTLHLHLTDDEGWRLQIRGLPELTEVGAFRGHTLDDQEHLHPSYGSGPDPDAASGYGSGYYSREDYIEILRYAGMHHVQVIPEFDLPGHARAAIMAMNARYRKYIQEGEEEMAEAFLLSDPEDLSEYVSAQEFDDNVICVCRESVYRFLELVMDDVQAMHEEAGMPLTLFHIGGDEVPRGAWEKSPICNAFMEENEMGDGAAGLMDYFLERTAALLAEKNLLLAGWEEIVLRRGAGGDHEVNKPVEGHQVHVYIWDNFTSGNQDIGYRIANAGYPVILCSVTNFYFELAYNKDPREPGHYWGGFVDTKKAFEYVPLDVYKSIRTNTLGKPYDPESDFAGMARLNPEARDRILGIQGELWSEPIKGPDMLEYFYLPKMLGLAERAWSRQPSWATLEERERFEIALQADWNVFANSLGQRELDRLDHLSGGYNYRLPAPGLKIEDGMLLANTQFPGLTIRYTTDGSVPEEDSPEYSVPVSVNGVVTARCFNTLGRGSMVSVARVE